MKKLFSKLKIRISFWFVRRKNKNTIHYIGGAETLPPPLSPQEEDELLSHLDTDEAYVRKKFIEHNLRLVVYIAKKFENTCVGIEDLISIGTIGLIKAVNTFRTDKNIKLATYASRCIENEILMYLRKSSSQKSEISIDETGKTYRFEIVNASDFTGYEKNRIYLDADKLGVLTLRSRKNGDTFSPLGLSGTKKVKDFLIDLKIPVHTRQTLPVLLSDEKIAAILCLRADEAYKVTEQTNKILISYEETLL